MANRDVNLIIRAKNQATKNLDSVSDALKVLRGAQDGVASSASKTDGAISGLTTELDKLKARSNAFEGLSRAKDIMSKAADAMGRLKGEVGDTRTKMDALGADTSGLTSRLSGLTSAQDALIAKQKAQQKEMESARQQVLKSSASMKELAAAERAYASAQKIKADTPKRDEAIAAAKDRLDAARASVDANNAAYNKLNTTLATTKSELSKVKQEITSVKASQRDLTREIDKTASVFDDQQQSVAKAEAEYAQIESSVLEASTALDRFGVNAAEATADTGKLVPQIERLGAVMQALMRYSTGTGQFVDPKIAARMQALRAEADAAKASWAALEAQAHSLSAEMQAAGGGTDAQKQSLLEIVMAANAASQEFVQLSGEILRVSGAGKQLSPTLQKVKNDALAVQKAQQGLSKELGLTVTQINHLNASANSANGMVKLNRESRQAMSVFQRLRGEVLSLATAYVGLYGTIQSVGGVLTAYQKMEAAQNRLGVVFEQNQSKIGTEMTWLQGQAARLGIEFGSLADQYSKFAIASQAAGFGLDETRKVFLSVAEAGRVNKLSLEDMNGTFLALQQMISKGKVSSEELRQQLGERLPGAMNIMADALGVTTGELYKMLEQGKILADSSTMIKFADELNRRFGSQLPKALQSTSAQMGKFTNNLFQAQLQVANGGFIDAFNRMMEKLNSWFQSRDGRDFFLGLGAAAGKAVDFVSAVVDNFGDLMLGLKLLVGLKVGQWFFGIVTSLNQTRAALLGSTAATAALSAQQQIAVGQTALFGARFLALGVQINAARIALTTFGVGVAATVTRYGALTGAMHLSSAALATFNARAVMARASSMAIAFGLGAMRVAAQAFNVALAAMGGPLGLIITLASVVAVPIFANWITGVDDATTALDEHQRIMGEVVQQYQSVTDKTVDWSKNLENVSLSQVEGAIIGIREQTEKLKRDLSTDNGSLFAGIVSIFEDGAQVDVQFAIDKLNKQFKNGEIDVAGYKAELDKLYNGLESNNTSSRKLIKSYADIADQVAENEKKTGELAVVAKGLGSTLDGVDEAAAASGKSINDLGGEVESTTKAVTVSTAKTEEFRSKLAEIRDLIPEITSGFTDLKDKVKLDEAFAGAAAAAQTIGELAMAVRDYNAALDGMYSQQAGKDLGGFTSGVDASKAILRDREGFQATGKWDVNAFRAGYGSDTVTLDDGSIHQITEGMRVSVADAERDLERRIGEFQGGIVKTIGIDRWAQFNAAQQGVLTSIAYNYGSLPERIIGAVRGGTDEEIAAAIRGLQGDNNGINKDRRLYEAGAFVQTASVDSQVKEYEDGVKKRAEDEARITEEKRKQSEETAKALADLGFENEMIQTKLAGKDKEAFIEEQIRALKDQNKNLTADQEASARELLARQFELNTALDLEKEKKTGIEAAEQRINDLETQRNALIQQRTIYEEQGNTTKVQEVEAELAAINTQLTEAITKANEMYATLGGAGADAAIVKNKTLALEVESVGTNSKKTAISAQQMQGSLFSSLNDGVINMFDAFASAIANGENAIGALGDAFRQFAADFLMQIAKMILQQTMFNFLQSISKSITGGLGGIMGFHEGGVIGTSTPTFTRNVAPAWFNNAQRYHSGGIAGLRPNEVPAILEAGEEVLTQNDPRHSRNSGKAQSGGNVRIINAFDTASFMSEALKAIVGEEAVLNLVRANPGAFKQAMEG